MAANYCFNCGEAYKENAVVCSNCGRPAPQESKEQENGKNEQTENENINAEQVYTGTKKPVQIKSTFFALLLSFFIPGLGQVYNGKFWKGIFFMIAIFAGAFFIIPGIIIWIWGLYDAYTEAEQINNGEKPYSEATVWEIIVFLLLPFILAAAIIFIAFMLFMFIFSIAAMPIY